MSGRRWTGALIGTVVAAGIVASTARSQEVEVEHPEPPRLDRLETDANGDGVPDGWYNLRDARWAGGGVGGPGSRCLRFENARPGRPARASRAFGVDGRKVGAIVVGLWVRVEKVGPGERLGDDPALVIDFLGDELRPTRRGSLGPWTKTVGATWTHVARRISVPPNTRDAILTVGLLGATGAIEVDDLAIEPIPVGTESGRNLVVNGDFELGDPAPAGWVAEVGTRRDFPGHDSDSSVVLTKSGARLLAGLGTAVDGYQSLRVSVSARARDLHGVDAAEAGVFFLDDDGRSVSGPGGNRPILRWSGTTPWATTRAVVPVPPGATRAVIQFEKTNAGGSLWLDDVTVTSSPEPNPADWRPYHVETRKDGWTPVAPSSEVAAGSALDASALLDAPAGTRGPVRVKGGRLAFADGTRARFFGVQLLPPVPFLEADRADALADRLARSGVNLVRLGDLDSALGPARSLFDDTREDTRAFDSVALARLDHLISALKARGIYVALEIQGARRFRPEDDVPSIESLPIGGGPAVMVEPRLRAATLKAADDLLGHVNPETGLSLRDDPVLAWVTLFGEVTLFDQVDDATSLPATSKAKAGARGAWRALESASLKEMADALRSGGLKAPLAGVSHWRREADFAQTVVAPGLDLVDDRLYWTPPTFLAPGHRSLVWARDGGLIAGAAKKRKADRPYVVGQWCDQTVGAWALPYEGADLMLAAATASSEDWDALVRRGVFVNPIKWGAAASGTGGGEDLYPVPETINAIPPVYALLPHAASILLRGHAPVTPGSGRAARPTVPGVPGWDARNGRIVVDTPHTRAVAGWAEGTTARFADLSIAPKTPYCVVAVSSFGREPIGTARRLLVTAVARVEPTGLAYVDQSRREVADPGLPPLLREPVRADVSWRHAGEVKAYPLDSDGRRLAPIPLEKTADGVRLLIDGRASGMHWELVAE